MFTIYRGLPPKSGVDRLSTPRKDAGTGLISIEDCVELVLGGVGGLEVYVHGNDKGLLQDTREDREESLEAVSVLKKAEKKK